MSRSNFREIVELLEAGVGRRELFAALALQGLLTTKAKDPPATLAAQAVALADALIAAIDA